MSEAPEHPGPEGDRSRHLSLEELEAAWAALPAPPADRGRVRVILARGADGIRRTFSRTRLSPEEGVPGDRWQRRDAARPDRQLAVIRCDVAELLANGQPITLAGDNLFVDLDLSAANLPVGTRLRLGDAEVVMSSEPHNGCAKFQARFGQAALRFISERKRRDAHLRGVYWTVVRAGEVAEGDPVEVLDRPPVG